jgi:hypothetical protein
MLGKGYLCAVVTQDAANWPTPEATSSCHGHGGTWSTTQFNLHNAAMGVGILPPEWPIRRPDNKTQTTKERMARRAAKHGLPAPANPSTDGSRQGLWEQSQRNWQTFAPGTHNRGETPHRQVVKALVNGEKAQTQCLTVDQVFAEEIKGTNRQESWATPIMGDSHLASTPEVAQRRIEEGKVTLSRQTAAWATPQLQDGHNINQDSTTHKTIPAQLTKMNMSGKLNPRWVETLMGLPVGWVMPSCASPVTIALTSCDSSETESSLPQPSELFAF